MRLGTDYETWKEALNLSINKIKEYSPDVLLVSLGVDTFDGDPVGGFRLLSDNYLDIGEKIRKVGKPTHFVLEGGYAKAELGKNVINVLKGFLS